MIYEVEEIYAIELQILEILKFDILFPTAYSFYSFDMKRRELNKEEEVLFKISIRNIEMLKNFKPSTIANSIKKMIKFREEGTELFSAYKESYDNDVSRCLDFFKQIIEYEVKLYKESLSI
jgi:hypothetical protein